MKLYVTAAVAALIAILGGVWAWTALAPRPDCGGGAVAGDIGGPFTLVSDQGETVTDADVITGPTLVYFGYTYCPDVCPLDASRNALATDLMAERGIDVRPVFITVDPNRDTPEVLDAYTANQHPDMLGLTGSQDQVDQAVAAYRVYANVNDDGTDQYLVDHTAFTYLMSPEGFVDVFRHEATADEIVERTACYFG